MIEGRVEYETLPHTADLVLVVHGKNPGDLFERCAAAMFDQILDVAAVRPDMVELVVEAEATGLDELLVAFLGELLGESSLRQVAFGAFQVESLEEKKIRARAWGEPLDPARHGFKTELKAVTYHALEVGRAGELWRAQVLFDV